MALRTPITIPLSVEQLQTIWQALNELYFGNRLPSIEIQWSTRLTASAGLFRSRTGPRTSRVAPEERHGKGRVIRLSVPLLSGQSFEEIRGTLAHEMIHQWQFDVKKCCPSHGREFRRVMALMNADGLGITIYHTLAAEAPSSPKFTWRCAWCGHAYHRQRHTLSTKRHRCGWCRGPLQEMIDRNRGEEPSPLPPDRVRGRLSSNGRGNHREGGARLPHPGRRGSGHSGGPIQLAFHF